MGKCLSKCNKDDINGEEVNLNHFKLLRSVGRGAFGKVRIVKNKCDEGLYALKYINKEKCITQKAYRNTIFERNLLESLEHPLIVNLRFAFQDEENMFMVLDLMLGGDMKYHLQTVGTFSEEAVKFYAAELIEAIDYLHKNSVVHRDIKPDNLLLDENGHIHLTDFNVACILPPNNELVKSFSGTITYMAPEVIARAGYREMVDWWSMGVVLYEFLFGKRPFRGKTGKEVATKIVKNPLHFPSHTFISNNCSDFISKLLKKSPSERLGSKGVEEIKEHPFLANVDWGQVPKKQLKPPFLPDPNKANFNAMFEAEDVLMEDKPLKKKKKKDTKEPSTIEEKYVKEHYLTFDYRKFDRRSGGKFDRSDESKTDGDGSNQDEEDIPLQPDITEESQADSDDGDNVN